ncbi:MAG: aspartate aminotransferase family protein [Acidobacteria bacterium 37-71-11]|nr:MAG: aspartate aminotransferase family protein [Acidobacteria bacterium 37-71-11]
MRAFRAVGGPPIFYREAAGARFTDEDGNSYLDYVMSWGPLILGHAHPAVVEAVRAAAGRGLSYGAPCAAEVALAEKVVASYPGCEMVRFVSSGTEAVMSAIRLARGATGRPRVLKFDGCYHGHVDSLLVKAGSGLATFGTPNSAGVPPALAELTVVVPLDDEAALEQAFAVHGAELAAAIVEPVPANAGLLVQRREFLLRLAELARRAGALLVFDEVISGFRLGPGGAAAHYGITPDLATFGKVIGGGMPVGAYGGRRDLMEQVSPLGAVYQAGTLSGNPVAMAAGLATLDALAAEDGWRRLESLGARLEAGVRGVLADRSLPVGFARLGSLFWLAMQPGEPPRRFDAVAPEGTARYAALHRALLERGVYFAPSAFEVGFLSLAHTEDDVDATVAALDAALAEAYR